MGGEVKSIGEVINAFLVQNRMSSAYKKTQIEQKWCDVAGQYIAHHTKKVFYANNILYVYLDTASLKHELMYLKSSIIIKFNQVMGGNVINDIKFS